MSEKLYQVALGLIQGIGISTTRTLISYTGSAEKIFHLPKGKLLQIPGIGEQTAIRLLDKKILQSAESILKRAEKYNTQILHYTDKDYPNRLKPIEDAPALLYYQGNVDLNNSKTVAIVGTRKATEYGKQAVEKLIDELTPLNPLVISGLAYGIDIAAHRSCLQKNLSTIGVMANGIDIIYPAAHQSIAKKMTQQGGLLSEYTFGTSPEPMRFPARNRIVAGMSDITIVVEAAKEGGALITAEIANSYNKEVMALPGRTNDTFSEGCNHLIQQHKAHIYTGIESLIKLMNWDKSPSSQSISASEFSDLSNDEKAIVNTLLNTEPQHIDDISWKSQLPLSKLSSLLLQLEFSGLIKSLPGKKYSLKL
jgi:DNA processing protein